MVLYRMFMSPITTKSQRTDSENQNDLLVGNIFANKNMSINESIYKSLMETLTLYPKKKHFKKLAAYIREHEEIEKV
jgi:hypothetical protein